MVVIERETDELEMFAEFCSSLTLESGERMWLEDFQRQMLGDYFAGARELLILIPKGNAKSTLLAMLALFELLTTPDAEIIIVAAARDQAAIMLRQAQGLVRRRPVLAARLSVRQREITNQQLGGRIRVLASDVDTGDGVIPSLVLLDELHRHRRSELYSVLRASLTKRNGQMVVISTAGDDEMSPLGELRTRAYGLPTQRRDGAFRYAASADGSFVMNEWSLDASQDLADLDLVKSANPLSTVTVEQLRERHDSPSTTPWAWARFTCGAWVRGEHSAIDPSDWDALETPTAVIPNGSTVTIGWDMAWRGPDTTAIVPVQWVSEERRVIGDPVIFEASEGGMVDDRAIKAAFVALSARWTVKAIVFDPNAGAAALAQQVARETGLKLVEHSQRDSAMALADGRLLEAIRRGQLQHSGHQVLRQHVLNAVEKPVGELFRFTRPKHGPRVPIDCLTALSMAHSVAVAESTKPVADRSVYFF
jgi:phage terminase large subunit-like protein